ncbi:TraB/GumN family protein [Pragia fontium]|uniref:Conjugal transfer protein TraB n=1 Tax=Pragia fontium DSM 5563 = ATCC 49100 TaxID=1122977 RepID=A0AAJ4W904_9GAMM|nr:TraB/GumN family protein [Pragia fontium]SFC34664.1 hypothetical protein SAMN02745723_102136 [Pragia fontium DSM 5563 = ATCC 49100]
MSNILKKLAIFLGFAPPLVCAYPAYDFVTENGSQLHLVGSIHMGTREMAPFSADLLKRLKKADALIVEVDISKPVSFETPDNLPDISQRLTTEEYQQLIQRLDELGLDIDTIATKPGWHAALVLQATQANIAGLKSEYGIDYQVLQAANKAAVPIIELEGADKQIALLQQIPDNGIPLLKDSLEHWQDNDRLLKIMVKWWLSQRPIERNLTLPYGMSGDLYQLMIANRNRLWATQLQALPKGNYVVVVGALHLFGESNLLELLKENQATTRYDNGIIQ